MSIIGGIIATSLFLGSLDKACKMDEQARKKFAKAYDKQCEAEALAERKKIETDNAMLKLANRKRAVLSTSIKDFIELYSHIKKINFLESDGIRELENKLMLPRDVVTMKEMTLVTTSSVAMTDEDVVKAFLMGGLLGASIVSDSKKNLKAANNQMKISNVVYSQTQTLEVALNAIIDRCDNFSDLLVKLNILFVKSIRNCESIIDKNQYDKNRYSEDDRKALMTCINIASTIKGLIDIPILDRDGEITLKSADALKNGWEYLNKIKNI